MSGRLGSGMRYLWPCLLVGGLAIVGDHTDQLEKMNDKITEYLWTTWGDV